MLARPHKPVSCQFICQPASLASARAALRAALPGNLDRRQQGLILLAAGEVWQNIIRHGAAGGSPDSYFGFRLKQHNRRRASQLWLTSWDSNPARDSARDLAHDPARDLASWQAPLPGSGGGFGLLLIARIASQTRYQRSAGLNIAVLVFRPDSL